MSLDSSHSEDSIANLLKNTDAIYIPKKNFRLSNARNNLTINERLSTSRSTQIHN